MPEVCLTALVGQLVPAQSAAYSIWFPLLGALQRVEHQSMEKVYHLDLPTLLEIVHGQSALLSTEIMVPALQGRCAGYLFFRHTAIIGCLVQAPNGTAWQEGEQAYRLLSASGEWRVRIDPNIEQTFRDMKQSHYQPSQWSIPSLSPALQPPRPIRALDPTLLNQFSTQQRLILRMVFMMVNGQRTVAQIEEQLRLPTETIEAALTRLRTLGVIE